MAVSSKVLGMMETASWIRRMFEAGNALRAQHGAASVCDFSLGNPDVEPPPGSRRRSGRWWIPRCR